MAELEYCLAQLAGEGLWVATAGQNLGLVAKAEHHYSLEQKIGLT